MQHIVNAQGLNMPKLGLGTWPMLGEECTRAVEQALALGYRHIDTAAAYNNEDAVGQALVNSPTPREQIHVTTKVWWDQLHPDAMRHSMERSLKALRSSGSGKFATPMLRASPCSLNETRVSMVFGRSQSVVGQWIMNRST